MTRTRRFVGGVTLSFLNLAVVTIVGLWLTPFLLDRLGEHDYGLWLLCSQIVGYLLLVDIGILALVPRETAYLVGRGGAGEEVDLPGLVARTRWLARRQAVVLALVAGLVWLALPRAWSELAGPLAVVLVVLVVTFPLRLPAAVLQGLQDLAFLGRVQLIAWLAGSAVTVTSIVAGFGLYSPAAGWAVTQLLSSGLALWRLRTRHAAVLPTAPIPVQGADVKQYLGHSVWLGAAQIAQVLVNATDMLIVGSLIAPAAVVRYACTGKLVMVMTNLPQLLTQSAAPALSELRVASHPEKLRQTIAALALGVMTVSGLIACLVLPLNRGFVAWWVGAGQFHGIALTAILLLSMLLRHWNTTLAYGLFVFGRERRLAVAMLGDGIVTVSLSIWLVSRVGLIGAPIASVAGVLLVSLPANLTALAAETGTSAGRLASSLGPWLWRFAALVAAAGLSTLWWTPATLLAMMTTAAVVVIVYVAVMVPGLLPTPLGIHLRPYLQPVWLRLAGAP